MYGSVDVRTLQLRLSNEALSSSMCLQSASASLSDREGETASRFKDGKSKVGTYLSLFSLLSGKQGPLPPSFPRRLARVGPPNQSLTAGDVPEPATHEARTTADVKHRQT